MGVPIGDSQVYPWFLAVVPQVFTDPTSDFATSPPTILSSIQLLFLPDGSLELWMLLAFQKLPKDYELGDMTPIWTARQPYCSQLSLGHPWPHSYQLLQEKARWKTRPSHSRGGHIWCSTGVTPYYQSSVPAQFTFVFLHREHLYFSTEASPLSSLTFHGTILACFSP